MSVPELEVMGPCARRTEVSLSVCQSVGCSFLEGEKLGPELGEEGGGLREGAAEGGSSAGSVRSSWGPVLAPPALGSRALT